MDVMYEWLPAEVRLSTDVAAADWVVSRLRPWDPDGVRVASYMPDVFDRYVRVFHPAGDRGGSSGLTWAEVASRTGAPFHPEVQFMELVGTDGLYQHSDLGDVMPLSGSLPPSLLRTLVGFLGRSTDPDMTWWFAMWDGNGSWWKGSHGGNDPYDDERDRVLRDWPRMDALSRQYFLMDGPLSAVLDLFQAAGHQSPAMWWPDDRSILLSTEVDAFSTYVGGSTSVVEALQRTDGIEAVPVRLDAALDWGL
jgi:hypothetical protein